MRQNWLDLDFRFGDASRCTFVPTAPSSEGRWRLEAVARRSSPLALARPKGQAGDEVSLEQDVDDQGWDDCECSARRDQVVVAEELPL
jgi:hypothetical protein